MTTYAGYVDQLDTKTISGWAANRVSPENIPHIVVVINDRRIAVIGCSGIRDDAVAAGLEGARGFFFRPTRFLERGSNSVGVYFADTDELVPNGTAQLHYDPEAAIDSHWSDQYANKEPRYIRWWQCDLVVRHVNEKVCGDPIPGLSHGLYQRVRARFAKRLPFGKAISVGCGEGGKEADALGLRIADSFDLFELSSFAVDSGRQFAAKQGLASRMRFHHGDAFELVTEPESFDCVFWNNSLHHMFDVDAALQWSYRVLRKGGIFIMDDYVGPTRMQWSDQVLEINTAYRRSLRAHYLADPWDPSKQLPVVIGRPDIDEFIAIDPSECADSERILPCFRRHFPDSETIITGGAIYHLGLSDVLHNIMTARDDGEIRRALRLDDDCIALGETQYAVGIGVK